MRRHRSRATQLALITGASLPMILTACGSSHSVKHPTTAASSAAAAGIAAGNPIEIGADLPLSGNQSELGQEYVHTLNATVAVINAHGGVLGRPLKVVALDNTGGSATLDIQNFHTFHSKGIDFVYSQPGNSSAGCVSLGPTADQLNVLYFAYCTDESLLAKPPANFYMTANLTTIDVNSDLVEIEKRLPSVSCWSVYSLDYLSGHDAASQFIAGLKAKNPTVKIAAQAYAPLSAPDVRPYIDKLVAAEPVGSSCGLWAYAWGENGAALLKQGVIGDLFSHYADFVLLGGSNVTMTTVGSKAPTYYAAQDFYPSGEPGSESQAVTSEYQKLTGQEMGWTDYSAANALLGMAAAMTKAGSIDVSWVRAALQGLTFSSVMGPMTVHGHYFAGGTDFVKCHGGETASPGWACESLERLPATAVTPAKYLSTGR